MDIRRRPEGSAVRQAYDICAVIPVIEGVGGCVLHTGRYPDSPAGSRFDRIELTDPGKTYASLVCLGQAGGALCAEALGMVAPMMAPDAGIPTPRSPLFLGRFSPVLRRFSAVILCCLASWRRDGENGRKVAENGRNLGEKRARNSGG